MMTYFEKRASVRADRGKKRQERAVGPQRSWSTTTPAPALTARSRKSNRFQQRMPSTLSGMVLQDASSDTRREVSRDFFGCRSRSREQILEDNLAPEPLAEERDVRARRPARGPSGQATPATSGSPGTCEGPWWESAGRRLRRRRPQPPPRCAPYCADPRATIPPSGPAGACCCMAGCGAC